jgi:hypothetical protein
MYELTEFYDYCNRGKLLWRLLRPRRLKKVGLWVSHEDRMYRICEVCVDVQGAVQRVYVYVYV